MRYASFTRLVGRTPSVRYQTVEAPEARIFVKIEGQNPTGSVKDRAGLYNLQGALEDGTLRSGQIVLDASSGNMACSLAYFAAVLGFRAEVACSSKLTEDKAAFIRYLGATLHRVGDLTIEANRYCRDVLVARNPGTYAFLDQLHNWNNPRAHYETTGPEILEDFPDAAAVVGSLGSGGTMNGVARFIRERKPGTQIVAVESESGTKIPGTGAFVDGEYETPFIKQIRAERLADHTIRVDLDAASRRTLALRQQGFFCGIQTGGVVDAAVRFSVGSRIHGDVVVISGDAGWKNMDKLRDLC